MKLYEWTAKFTDGTTLDGFTGGQSLLEAQGKKVKSLAVIGPGLMHPHFIEIPPDCRPRIFKRVNKIVTERGEVEEQTEFFGWEYFEPEIGRKRYHLWEFGGSEPVLHSEE